MPNEAYCVRCKAKREIVEPERKVYKNGVPAIAGKCAVCGTKVSQILRREAASTSA